MYECSFASVMQIGVCADGIFYLFFRSKEGRLYMNPLHLFPQRRSKVELFE